MKKINRFLIAAALGGTLSIAANAATINQRRENQQDRIAQGIASGNLSAGEAARLEHSEARVNREIRDDREDHNGHLAPAERKQINRQQNQLSRRIYTAKHDGYRK